MNVQFDEGEDNTSLPTQDRERSDSGTEATEATEVTDASSEGSEGSEETGDSSLYEEEDFSSQLKHYVIRITSYDKFTFEDVRQWLSDQSEFTKFVVARETQPREHFHIVLSTELELSDVKDSVRWYVSPFWADKEGKLPRGFGNKQYNSAVAKDLDGAISYALKDKKEYAYEGYRDEYIRDRISASFQKKKPVNFKAEYIQLESLFMESDMSVTDFIKRYGYLKAKYGQQLSYNNAKAVADSIATRRDPSHWDAIVDERESRY